MAFLTKIFGDPHARYVANLQPTVAQINALEPQFKKLSDDELRGKTAEFRHRLEKNETGFDDLLPEAFAAAREAAVRALGQRHFDVQLLGGIVLNRGAIAEMRTGEGKTLVATAPAYLNALPGKGVHVITVNDYLARRDAVWMGKVYHALGLSVGCITHESAYLYDPHYQQVEHVDPGLSPEDTKDLALARQAAFKVEHEFLRPVSRQEAYLADITYGTNNEYGFDYLRDNMVTDIREMVQRGHNFAIVDEVDSILVDEARTPLIISAPAEESAELYYKFADLTVRLKENDDYNVDEKMRAATLTEGGIAKLEKMLGVKNLYDVGSGVSMVHHAEQALRAHALYHRDTEYVVKDGQVIIVDEFTGRLMPGRRWSEGLHQAVEAKERVKIERESQTLATITFQNYFRMYRKLAGMTGTAATESEEFHKIYGLEVVVIPTNKVLQRADLPDRVYKNEIGKFQAVVKEVKERHMKGQPVLIGTISIEKNEILSQLLEREGVPHKLLNAKNHEKEGETIAQAGHWGAVTVATNMAGRGVDIILGGNPADPAEAKKVREAGGLYVLGTERHESRRIDNQLRGRSGRQGDPGATQFYVSLEDDLMRIFAGDRVKALMTRFNIPEDMPIESKLVSRSIESAQSKVEQHNFDIRKHLLEYDDVLNKHREGIYKKRREILQSSVDAGLQPALRENVLKMIEHELEQVVLFHTPGGGSREEWNIEEILEVARTIFAVPNDMREKLEHIRGGNGSKLEDTEARTKIVEILMDEARRAYDDAERKMSETTQNEQAMRQIEKALWLRAIDTLWIEHLDAIEHLRRGIGLRAYGQQEPLIAYKKEAYQMFQELQHLIEKQVVYSIFKVGVVTQIAPSLLARRGMQMSAPAKTMEKGRDDRSAALYVPPGGGQAPALQGADSKAPAVGYVADHPHAYGAVPTEASAKVGRNDPCPCGSGKKYKKCHGA
ncbi:preprotein translocase subunit SecA [Candidatus Uhrbacteria bacterium RIFCSPLOWO2_01_FULL_47_24]|uniref:Protein translocase subunit SecA n=1 Tax=Candidatus Uhrbacteria bacterium RIFCSPLOWO2_01_FULL_47_24 TaxID=1802401 RepID=A0A1F7UNM8_9BACT|nr:MAG: preprotein translocase subunit SecA [Candidatus Uhrbacteria bacterium RIFCSPHIGHO2_01_FULL_47_11]OGL67671.1 MAG: preprotein translocase subunit SecA [Candidatus Uhrbacteria bacterium RIFCSPHIGHO2_02_FULL_46_47]OGL74854.1 MAG: preprotein translocase subunit SecA [Candidatus Uhrbacteria bacterium RIFCSPHIGHO2_12_FULL_47_11]OGL79876.1 MAG: preprotein translocase subunit SecA [Candidatus Uhrbacteria bacterium RIFCSPLOWO2_01_FULL_47_24]OGL84096.1 MAG: preprotein translocase subunit SecA [Can